MLEQKTNPFKIQQALHGIELYDIKMDYYQLKNFLNSKFMDYHSWLAFDHKFFISDKLLGRHETIRIVELFLYSIKSET